MRNMQQDTDANQGPIQRWVAAILNYGGHFTILGLPPILATLVFSIRMRWLKQHHQPHAANIAEGLITRILRLPMSFFDTTPMSRIMSRFSSDMEAVGSSLPRGCNGLFVFIPVIGGTLFVIAYSASMSLAMVPSLEFTYYLLQNYFIKISASLKRPYYVFRSPLYQHFSETVSGVSMVHTMRDISDQFIRQNEA
ncbi:hypothetical protein BGZ50_000749 [Haplosporangium sp. Z 11]|nr:hypothetical protein BGZ50_000749 [Haplosporangium sp. Z 11]